MDLGIDADELNTCVQCGLCLSACPTFRVTGDETMSPRGRIALMREVQHHDAPLTPEVVTAFETCVQCRGCEPACPSGVPYGRLMERTREALVEHGRHAWLAARRARAARSSRLLRAGSVALGIAQRLHLVPDRLGLSGSPASRIPLRQPSPIDPTPRLRHVCAPASRNRAQTWISGEGPDGCTCSPGA